MASKMDTALADLVAAVNKGTAEISKLVDAVKNAPSQAAFDAAADAIEVQAKAISDAADAAEAALNPPPPPTA